ncbi:MAG: ribonuclease III [Lachnospiraceae bacterium]|nr:ribonuclease III [Lachnospiraceae bacterium]
MNKNIQNLENEIGYVFNDKELLMQALTHSSYVNDRKMDKNLCNERLEFLGDAILEMTSSEFLYSEYPEKDEGELTKLRASLVSETPLAAVAGEIGLGEYLYLGHGEERTGGRTRYSVTSDAVEAVIGAIYLDGGIEPARAFVRKYILNDIENKKLFHDSKTVLQEIVQKYHKGTLTYRLVKEEGPDHDKKYGMNALIDEKIIGYGEGRTKKAAEQQAAYSAIKSLNKNAER